MALMGSRPAPLTPAYVFDPPPARSQLVCDQSDRVAAIGSVKYRAAPARYWLALHAASACSFAGPDGIGEALMTSTHTSLAA